VPKWSRCWLFIPRSATAFVAVKRPPYACPANGRTRRRLTGWRFCPACGFSSGGEGTAPACAHMATSPASRRSGTRARRWPRGLAPSFQFGRFRRVGSRGHASPLVSDHVWLMSANQSHLGQTGTGSKGPPCARLWYVCQCFFCICHADPPPVPWHCR
jgi:hypothetical protein